MANDLRSVGSSPISAPRPAEAPAPAATPTSTPSAQAPAANAAQPPGYDGQDVFEASSGRGPAPLSLSSGSGPTPPSVYTVEPGDTLSGIAARHGTTVDALVQANNLSDPNQIQVGQRLAIPGSDGSLPPPGQAPAASSNGNNLLAQPLGALSRRYESNGDPGAISNNGGDPGGASYGAYQFATNAGTPQAFVQSLQGSHPDWYAQLAGKQPGTQAFNAAWGQIAQSQPDAFLAAQHDYVQTQYYDAAASAVSSKYGLDVNSRSKALQDVLWSTAVQHGVGGATDIFGTALNGRDPGQVGDEDLIRGVYAERGRENPNGTLAHFGGSDARTQQSVRERFQSEQADALAELQAEQAAQQNPA